MTETPDTPAVIASPSPAGALPDPETLAGESVAGESLASEILANESLANESLETSLEALAAAGGDAYSPARFAFVAALLRRAAQRKDERAGDLRRRARQALAQYIADLRREDGEARELARTLLAERPELAEAVATRLAAFDYRGLRSLARLHRRAAGPGPLARLLEDLDRGARDEGAADDDALASHLQVQERELLAGFEASPRSRPELRSARGYRQIAQRAAARQRVADSLASSPPDSGPLNPQKLAARALEAMERLSPACSARYVSYIDTLFYLESLRED